MPDIVKWSDLLDEYGSGLDRSLLATPGDTAMTVDRPSALERLGSLGAVLPRDRRATLDIDLGARVVLSQVAYGAICPSRAA